MIVTDRETWPKVTRERPCPKCGHTNRCTLTLDGLAGVCWREGTGKHWRDEPHKANNGNGRHRGNGLGHLKPKRPAPTFICAEEAINAVTPSGAVVVKSFSYPKDGARMVRLKMADDSKEFRPVHRTENGDWKIGDPPGALPLYRHDELPATGTVYVTEGEGCADLAWEIGLPAVTAMHGSAAPTKSDWTPLAGRDVVILIDSDDPGRKFGRIVAQILIDLGCTVRIADLFPDKDDGSDIAEFDAEYDGFTKQKIEELATAAPLVESSGRGLVIKRADAVERTEIEWAWFGWLPFGKIIVFFGFPDAGKGTLAAHIVAILSVGGEWPDGTRAPKCSSLIVSTEDDISDTITRRLDAADADSSRVYFLTGVNEIGEDGETVQRWFTLDMIGHVRDTLKKHSDIRLLVIDPPAAHMPDNLNDNSQSHVRSLIGPWAELAQEFKIMVLFVMHRPKGGGGKAIQGAIGSTAWIAAARVGCMVARDKNDPNLRLLLRAKNNLAPPMPNLSFRIIGPVAHVEWAGAVETTADEVAFADSDGRPGPEPKKLEAAKEWLAAELADFEPCPVEKLKDAAKAAALVWRTVQRASAKVGVKVERCKFQGGYTWRLPRP